LKLWNGEQQPPKEMGAVRLITVLDGKAAISQVLKEGPTLLKIGSLTLKPFTIKEFL
jgi:hypothetical protein